MKASETSLLKFLDGSKQFLIPTYQRTYSWTLKQCKQLRDDIIRVGKDENSINHFIGGIVHISEESMNFGGVFKTSVIDGQQRLTTCSLLLHALATAENSNHEKIFEKLNHKAVINYDEEGDDKYKLLPTKIDKENYISVLEGKNLQENSTNESNIITNYNFFKEKIAEYKDNLEIVSAGISKLFIVDIALDRSQDNPQLIFESMNSTGLALSKGELIKNYLLMGMKSQQQKELYDTYWYQMDRLLENNAEWYDKFFRDYLTYKSPSGVIPKERYLYDDFKTFFVKSGMDTEGILKDIEGVFRQYAYVALLKNHPDTQINSALQDIDTLKVVVAYPLLIELFIDYEQGNLQKEHLVEFLRTIETYVFRRAICEIPTNSLNKTFAIMKKNFVKTTSQTYYDSFMVSLQTLKSYKELPTDDYFMQEIVKKDVYNFRNCKYLLRKLENHSKKETVNVDNYTVEHIMPQNKNLSQEWKNELGENRKEVHAKYIHTLGNLTLTGYNSEYSDKPFTEKKLLPGKGFNASPVGLNGMLRDIDQRNETQITTRAQHLAELASKVWGYKKISEDIIKQYIIEEEEEVTEIFTYEHHTKLVGKSLELFEGLKTRILSLHPDIREEIKKLYIAFKYITNFVDIEVQKDKLRLTLNTDIEDIKDPRGLCKDVKGIGRRGNGNVSVYISELEDTDYIMSLIQQSLDKQFE